MASEQFSQAVRGSSGRPISTSESGSMQTDNYEAGDAFDAAGGYPVTIEATDINAIQEILLFEAGDIDVEIQTIQGQTFTIRLHKTVGEIDTWEIQQATFSDPRGTGAALSGAWGGE